MTPAERAADAYAERVEHDRVAVAEEQVASQAAYDDHLRAGAIRDVQHLVGERAIYVAMLQQPNIHPAMAETLRTKLHEIDDALARYN